ncbi:tRNA (adenosine(37)-N6)-dimethylallyltransferase MiaA [Endomicrobium proavitum]|uniref:tRNA dimethylallyltransferase n=1 Tax=Endomicrobium proavitum TaxID=1408281 RepID=A0A0G3WIZ9_9BACT|nr:tRNA (adenosine(37)-N6)-dimethylallyltransferase MiaA [Endomicrobium proavitum]AKL97857.1 tRNA dimethylallyltransferase [Endomicrobium proavitum]
MKKIIVISGPTASGKTKYAVEFCKKNNGEIISADSRQIYKYLDVGTNKEGQAGSGKQQGVSRNINNIAQYLTDIINPDKTYSAADFAKDADLKIKQISDSGKLPVIVGGTGLYIKALLYGLDNMPKADEKLREKLKNYSADELYRELLKLDPAAAEKNKKNPQRLLRALEINILSGKKVEEHIKPKSARYNFKHYTILIPNKTLYERINSRCAQMLKNGMIEETQKVLDMGFAANAPALSGIGYRNVIKYLNKEFSKTELLEEFSKDTRHYAKRQNTWFKAQPDTEILELPK